MNRRALEFAELYWGFRVRVAKNWRRIDRREERAEGEDEFGHRWNFSYLFLGFCFFLFCFIRCLERLPTFVCYYNDEKTKTRQVG